MNEAGCANVETIKPLLTGCLLAACALCLIMAGCAARPPLARHSDNICLLFEDNRAWFKSARRSSRQWGVSIPVLMSIMFQESGFNAKVRPPRTTCCFFIPGPRPSSAYGYAQALDSTWEKYKQATDNHRAKRDNFHDAIDFIGWYCHLSRVQCRIPADDAYAHYLAYHEGQGGYSRQTYQNKAWLKKIAGRVQGRSDLYTRQLAGCQEDLLDSGGCCFFWPF